MSQETFTVTIPVPNDEPLRGKFVFETRLSVQEVLSMDALRRGLLGPSAGAEAFQEAAYFALALAKLQTQLKESPSWWKDGGNGLKLEPEQVLAVFEAMEEAAKKAKTELKAASEEARKKLEGAK
jgi:hypothetical protein